MIVLSNMHCKQCLIPLVWDFDGFHITCEHPKERIMWPFIQYHEEYAGNEEAKKYREERLVKPAER